MRIFFAILFYMLVLYHMRKSWGASRVHGRACTFCLWKVPWQLLIFPWSFSKISSGHINGILYHQRWQSCLTSKSILCRLCAFHRYVLTYMQAYWWWHSLGPAHATRPRIHHPALGKHLNFYRSPCFVIDLQNLMYVRPKTPQRKGPGLTASCPWPRAGDDVTVISGRLQAGTQLYGLGICIKDQSEGP